MDLPEYSTEFVNNLVGSFTDAILGNNESSSSLYENSYDSSENIINNSKHNTGGSQHLETILQQLFSKMSDNQSMYDDPSNQGFSSLSKGIISPLSLSRTSSSPVSLNTANSYHVLSVISLWFVLIVNPVVIFLGVVGNLLAIYILITGNIAKLPVLFYTIMLNISDTLNLLIPVLIFWLDNCFNRTPDRGYFRDRSNFLCKALMCPDQLFAALSAWYMCAISFNRWCSVCRPSAYFFHTKANLSKTSKSTNDRTNSGLKKYLLRSSTSSSLFSFCFPFDYCFCLMHRVKHRQHLRAFRVIGIITLFGVLCCVYPIFMHELRVVISTNQHSFDLIQKITHTQAFVWKRCYYSQKHEHSYDIIGIILSSFLHILPLTSVGAMNIMIIVRLKERQRLMSTSSNTVQSVLMTNSKKTSFENFRNRLAHTLNSSYRGNRQTDIRKSLSTPSLVPAYKGPEPLGDSPRHFVQLKNSKVILRLSNTASKRHQSRDRNITIMLVSVALSYLILTLPYRLFWSYNVYIKRIHPEKLKSSVYLLKMHYIDHVLRTIRNIHYGTNFIFFIFLSKPFRQKFRQLFMGKCGNASQQPIDRNTTTCANNLIRTSYPQKHLTKLEETNEFNENLTIVGENYVIRKEDSSGNSYNETPSLVSDARIQEDALYSIIKLEHDDQLHEL